MVWLNEEREQVQEPAQLDGHDLLRFPDIRPLEVPMRNKFIGVFLVISFVLFFFTASLISDAQKGIPFLTVFFPALLGAMFDSLLFTSLFFGLYYFFSIRRKKMKATAGSVMQQVNERFGTTFADDPRQLFVGLTHARDKRFKSVALVFDSRKRKVLVLAHYGLLEGEPLAFVEDYDYIRSVHYSSAGGSTTSGVAGYGSVAIPFSFSTSNTNEIAILLKDPELVEVRVSIYGHTRDVRDKFQQLGALINP